MSKTDKELTAEIVIAAINSDHKLPFGNSNISPSMKSIEIQNLIKATYHTLQSLDDTSK